MLLAIVCAYTLKTDLLRCLVLAVMIGDPPSFQGAERDIIFLTVIASPGSVPTQNQLMHFQRLNVAMSRARDRCYLVRSIDPHDIPNTEDAKLLLLTFFQSDQLNSEHTDTNSTGCISRSIYGKLLATLLEKHGFVCRPMGQVWRHGICVESEGSDARAAVLVDCVGEHVHEWANSYSQQRAIERVGWKCLRVDAISLVTDFHGTVQSIIAFLQRCGIEEKKLLYVELEDDSKSAHDEDVVVEEQGEEVEDFVEGDEAQADVAEVDDREDNLDVVPVAGPGEEEVYVISSDDGANADEDGVTSDDFGPLPEAVGSGMTDPSVDRPDQFGQVVDLGFLRHSLPEMDIEGLAAKAKARAKEAPREGAYEGDASDMGDSLLSRGSKRKRQKYQKLDRYARDPRWRPSKTGETKDDEQADWYDTDSDLMDGEDDGKSDTDGR